MSNSNNSLICLWTVPDAEVALNMIFMYALNSKRHGWWKDVKLIIWGPSAETAAIDPEIQKELERLLDEGVEVEACKACAEIYGVKDKLEELGVNVYYIGEQLTEHLQQDNQVLTF